MSKISLIIISFLLISLLFQGGVAASQSQGQYYVLEDTTMTPGEVYFDDDDTYPIESASGWSKITSELRHGFTAIYSRAFGLPSALFSEFIAIGILFLSAGGLALLVTRNKIPESTESRPMILYNLIRENPGINLSEIEELTGHSRGSVSYNVHRLTKASKIRKIARDTTTHLYTTTVPVNEEEEVMRKILSQKNQHKIFETVAAIPGISQRELTETTGIPQTTLQWHLSQLLKYDAVEAIRDQKYHMLHRSSRLCPALQPHY